MSALGPFILVHKRAREGAQAAIRNAPDGFVVKIVPPTRTLEQSAKFHAMCDDFARSGIKWQGRCRTAAEWKVLLVSAHAIASGDGHEIVAGLEGEFVNIRESTAQMSKARSASLIASTQAYGDTMGVVWSEPAVAEVAA